MQRPRSPLESQPPNNEATPPATRLGREKERLNKSAKIPPEKEESKPRYGPIIIPMMGARIVAAVMVFPIQPIICDRGIKDKITYSAVKHAVKAMFLVVCFSFVVFSSISSILCMFKQDEHP